MSASRDCFGVRHSAFLIQRLIAGAVGALTVLTSTAAELNVFAAASLSEAMKDIAAAYEKRTGEKIVFNFGASSTLARQIQEGAPADVFFSADEARMDALEKQELILKETRRSRLSNSLVIVVAADSRLSIHSAGDLAGHAVRRIALADPKAVPAGIYAREYLEKLGLWPVVERKIVPTENVRAALAAVESGNVDAGMVYKTDARVSTRVRVACEVKPAESPRISYAMAVLKESRRIESAKKFLGYLDSEMAETVFEKYGFIVRK